jgi:threonyl-tRNA synthetase
MFANLVEHFGGKWPFWLSPRQVIIATVSEKFIEYAEQVRSQLHAAGFFVDMDTTDKKLPKKIREAQLAQYNYILVVGQEEVNSETINVRTRDNIVHGSLTVTDLIRDLNLLVKDYK